MSNIVNLSVAANDDRTQRYWETHSKKQLYLDAGLRLRTLRRHLGHTPESFADALGMTKRAYLPYEKGQRNGHVWTRVIFRIVGLDLPYPVSLDWLITGKDRPGGDRKDNHHPLFIFPDNVVRSMRPLPLVTERSGNVVTVDFIGAS